MAAHPGCLRLDGAPRGRVRNFTRATGPSRGLIAAQVFRPENATVFCWISKKPPIAYLGLEWMFLLGVVAGFQPSRHDLCSQQSEWSH